MKQLLINAIIVLMLPVFCFAGDLYTDYTAKKAAGLIDRIEIDEGYVGPEVRYRVFIKRFSEETGKEVEPEEIYVIIEHLQIEKARVESEAVAELQAKAQNLVIFIQDLKAIEKE